MKYKLINIKTKEEHLCDKVTIDGFDYYVTDNSNDLGGWHIDKEFKILSNVSRFNVVTEMREIIATNNPNIDIPKVVDEVEVLANEQFKHLGEATVAKGKIKSYVIGYNKSQETHPFSEEDMIEFLNYYQKTCLLAFNSSGQNHGKTTKELLQLWKEQRPKTVYYE